MFQMQRDVQQHVTILGWLYIVGYALFLVVGVFVFLLLTGIGASGVAEEAGPVLVVVGTTVGLLLAALSLPGLAAGYGLLTRRPWARVLALVVGILGLANVPLGTVTGLYALWVLSPPEARAYFAAPTPA
ncbi:MAG TPA: hypothetical protein VFW96_02625 [Thermomicrobiales bacterium]|nr:hypothetical protein [Thermomicrobiales bacterium]